MVSKQGYENPDPRAVPVIYSNFKHKMNCNDLNHRKMISYYALGYSELTVLQTSLRKLLAGKAQED